MSLTQANPLPSRPKFDTNSPAYKAQVLKVVLLTLGLGLLGSTCLAYKIHHAEETRAAHSGIELQTEMPD